MNYKIEVGENDKGTIHYETLPIFRYFLREMGVHVNHDSSKKIVQLSSALTKKKILISAEDKVIPQSFRKHHLERKVLNQVQQFLQANGADVSTTYRDEQSHPIDLQLKFSLLEVPNIKEPLLELTTSSKTNLQKLIEVLQSECGKKQMRFKLNDRSGHYDATTMKIQIFSPVISNDEFWNRYGETYAMIITLGIYARFLGNSPLSAFSLIPIENLLTLFSVDTNPKAAVQVPKKDEPLSNQKHAVVTKTKDAAAFFDYHLLIDEGEEQKVQLHGNLHIKNVGSETLRNPVICIKATPSKGIKITGQILPKNFAQTKGVLNQDGATGWRYLNENWLEEFEEKGEIWICPIHSILIPPKSIETLPNLQIQLLDPEQKTVRVEAFIYMREDQLEFKANNQISLSLLKKVEANREQKE